MMRVTLVGTAFCLLQAVREIAALFPRPGERRGVPLYAVYEDADGRLMLYAHGAVRELRGGEAGEVALLDPVPRR
jgi:hypothetical protein